MPTSRRSQQHRRQGSDMSQTIAGGDPCTNIFINQLGSMIEYLDNSCTSAVEGIRFPSDSTTVLGDMDTVDLEQMELDTIMDTVDMTEATSDMKSKSAYSFTTGGGDDENYYYDDDDIDSTALSLSTRTSSRTPPTSSSSKKGQVAKFHLVGRLHAKVPETNTPTRINNKRATFDDNSIVTAAPTESFSDSNVVESNNNAMMQEEKEEATIVLAPKYFGPLTEAQQKDVALAQGLDLCRRIRQKQYPNVSSSPSRMIQQQRGSFLQESKAYDPHPFRQSISNDAAAAAVAQPPVVTPENNNVCKTKMYGENAFAPPPQPPQQEANHLQTVVVNNNSNNNLLPPPVPKRKSGIHQKLKGMVPVPLRARKASF